jgi:AbrB family looped-hinge helix DNA binding protein
MKGKLGMKAKVTAREQVSIPAEIRKTFNIERESRGRVD